MGSADEITLNVPQGSFELRRFPTRPNEQLQAWDAADELALQFLSQAEPLDSSSDQSQGTQVLIANDAFGALGVALAAHRPISWSDSSLAHRALKANLAANSIDCEIETLPSVLSPNRTYDVVILKVPKSNSFLEDQLIRLRPSLRPGTVILAAGMVKHIHTSTLEIFERILGPTRTSLAKKKARLVHTEFDAALSPEPSKWPKTWPYEDLTVFSYPGVFSADKVDIGTRFLLDNLPADLAPGDSNSAWRIVDLGCGTGVIGTVLGTENRHADLTFVDESYSAVASARATFQSAFPGRQADFKVASGLAEAVERGHPIDLVITNPPFHQNQHVTDAAALQMFSDAHQQLAISGELLVVGNRHLGYHLKLKRLFGNCITVKGNRKFVVLRSRKT